LHGLTRDFHNHIGDLRNILIDLSHLLDDQII
jgi:hypothetical protein